jgi:hypothetical protein
MELRDLQRMTVTKLREEALKHPGFVGVHAMNKEQLITALAPIFGIDLEAAARAARERFAGNKTTLKQEIRALKAKRDAILGEHDGATLKQLREGIKRRKRQLRRLAEQAARTATA